MFITLELSTSSSLNKPSLIKVAVVTVHPTLLHDSFKSLFSFSSKYTFAAVAIIFSKDSSDAFLLLSKMFKTFTVRTVAITVIIAIVDNSSINVNPFLFILSPI